MYLSTYLQRIIRLCSSSCTLHEMNGVGGVVCVCDLEYSDLTSSVTLPVIRVPVAAEHGASVSREHPLVAIGSSDVPQLDVSVFKGSGERKIVLHAELDVPHALRLTCTRSTVHTTTQRMGPVLAFHRLYSENSLCWVSSTGWLCSDDRTKIDSA